MKSIYSRILVIVVAAIIAVLAVSCGYKVTYNLSGGSIPPEAKTFSVAYFPNNAPMVAPTLSNALTEGLRDKFSRQTRLQQVEEGGDFAFEGDLYVIESTSPIGTTEKMAELIFCERPDLKGKLYIAYCPERVLPGNIIHEVVHNDRVIGGLDEASTDKAKEFYGQFVQGKLHATNCRTAEMCKLTENASRDVQIAFANELSLICDKAGINVWELIDLANKHPRVNILQPGCGVGGHCIAVDPYFISSAYPNEARIISQAREINNYKAQWCAEKVRRMMLEFELKNHRTPQVAMMGLAFKPNIDDLRESPAKFIASRVLHSCNRENVMVVEPNITEHNVFKLTNYKTAYEKADIVVYLVNHREFAELNYRTDVQVLDFCGVFKK